jgi:hypothetical protein
MVERGSLPAGTLSPTIVSLKLEGILLAAILVPLFFLWILPAVGGIRTRLGEQIHLLIAWEYEFGIPLTPLSTRHPSTLRTCVCVRR